MGELGKRFAHLLDDQLASQQNSQYLERILIKSSGRVMFLDVADIDWIEAAGVYVNLHVGNKAHLYRATVGQLRERLDPAEVRTRSPLDDGEYSIAELQPRTHGDYAVILKTGVEVSLSRGYRSEFETWLRQPL